MSELIGKTLGRFRLVETIGEGGMSTVYKAKDLDSDRMVAVKVLSSYIAREERFRRRFMREIALLSDLDDDNIVPILSYGEQQGTIYIVMPLYPGGTLQDLVDAGLTLPELQPVLRGIGRGLDHAHEAGIVHRDIKSSNVLIDDDGEAVISDFGFAYVSDIPDSLTGSVLIGTPAFMSPEQCRGEKIDGRSDQYSLGAVLYTIAVGKLPYVAETPMGVVVKHINDPLPRPRFINPEVPDAIEAVIIQAMAKDPEQRFASVGEFAEAFAAAIAAAFDPATGEPRPNAVGPTPKTIVMEKPGGPIWRSRSAAAALLILLVVLPVTAFALTGGLADPDPTSTSTPSLSLLATIEALSTANAEALAESDDPGAVETAVAGTVDAMGLFDPTQPPVTSTPLPTVTATPTPTLASGAGPPPPPPAPPPPGPPPPGPPPPPPTATSTPTETLTEPPTSTAPPPTATQVATIIPAACKATPTHPNYCTPTPNP